MGIQASITQMVILAEMGLTLMGISRQTRIVPSVTIGQQREMSIRIQVKRGPKSLRIERACGRYQL